MIEITELDELLNTLATSALEPHEEYKMEFSNKEQKLIYNYINQLQQENNHLKQTHDYDLKMIDEVKGNSVELFQENKQLKEQNEELKQKLNWIAFGDDPELALRYLRKIGYVDFDEERKVYINKHNNEPFWLDDEEEKTYFIKDEELNEYTKQLEQENKQLKEQLLEETKNNYKLQDELSKKTKEYQETYKDVREEIKDYKNQLKQRDAVIDELIVNWNFLEKYIDKNKMVLSNPSIFQFYLMQKEILQKYKGDNHE